MEEKDIKLLLALPAFFLLLAVFAVALPRPAAAVTVERVESPGGIVAWLVRDSMVPLVPSSFHSVVARRWTRPARPGWRT